MISKWNYTIMAYRDEYILVNMNELIVFVTFFVMRRFHSCHFSMWKVPEGEISVVGCCSPLFSWISHCLLFLFFQLKKYGSNVVFSQSWIQFLYNSIVTYFSGCAKHPLHQTIWQCHSRLKKPKKKSTVAPAIPRVPQHTIAPGANVLPWRAARWMSYWMVEIPKKMLTWGWCILGFTTLYYMYIYICIYILHGLFKFMMIGFTVLCIYIYNYPQMVYVNGVSNPCWGR